MKKVIVLCLCILALTQCEKGFVLNCTDDLRIISVEIADEAGQAASVEAYYVVRSNTNDTILTHASQTYMDFGFLPTGEIVIFSDIEKEHTTLNGVKFRLTAYFEGIKVIDEDYVIRHDRCHVELVSGKTKIVI